MKKLKWMVLCVLVLLLVGNIKANNCVAPQKEKPTVMVKAQSVKAPATIIEQILFPHGI